MPLRLFNLCGGSGSNFGLKVEKVYPNNLEHYLIIKGKAHIYLGDKNRSQLDSINRYTHQKQTLCLK